MKSILPALFASLILSSGCDRESQKPDVPQTQTEAPTAPSPTTNHAGTTGEVVADDPDAALEVTPLQHATMLLEWNGLRIAVDPVAGAFEAANVEIKPVDLVLVTDIHGDHLDAQTIVALSGEGTTVVAPQAVVDQEKSLKGAVILANGASKSVLNDRISVRAVPMYNIERKRDDSGEPFHVKGRGNGYVLKLGEKHVYISGDTECVPEMKALEDIDVAFVCMNLPYTMTPKEAAGCVREFKPKVLYPYHHRGQDPTELNDLLKDVPEVEIKLLDWYPAAEK